MLMQLYAKHVVMTGQSGLQRQYADDNPLPFVARDRGVHDARDELHVNCITINPNPGEWCCY